MRTHPGWAVTVLVLTGAIIALAGPDAAAAPATAGALVHHISGVAGDSGQLRCGATTRTKDVPGSITMVLTQAPTGPLLVRLQNAKNGTFLGEQKLINTGTTPSTLLSDVLAGTQFHVCAASPTGSPGGPYHADLSY